MRRPRTSSHRPYLSQGEDRQIKITTVTQIMLLISVPRPIRGPGVEAIKPHRWKDSSCAQSRTPGGRTTQVILMRSPSTSVLRGSVRKYHHKIRPRGSSANRKSSFPRIIWVHAQGLTIYSPQNCPLRLSARNSTGRPRLKE